MVVLEEDPHKLLSSLQENFGIDGDISQLSRISSHLHALRASRQKAKDDQQRNLRTLSRGLQSRRQAAEEAAKTHEEQRFPEQVAMLDRKKFALAKGLNELESSAHTLEGQLARLKEELEALDADDPVERAVVEGADEGITCVPFPRVMAGMGAHGMGDRLKLRVFRNFGIELTEDGAGGYSKAAVRDNRGELTVVKLEEKKFTPHFYVNYFWDML